MKKKSTPPATKRAGGVFNEINTQSPARVGFRPHASASPSAFLAYEIASAAVFTLLFAPYALFKMIGTPAFRAGLGQRFALGSALDRAGIGSDPVWIQAVSLGEVKSVAPLVLRIDKESGPPIFLTSTTATGFDAAARLDVPSKSNAYFPLDFSPIVSRALAKVRPRAIVLFETEIWPNLIRAAASRGIAVCIVNGRISKKSYNYYRALPKIFGHVLSRVSYAGMQSRQDADRALQLGVRPEAVDVCGNMKFDSAPGLPSPEIVESLRAELGIDGGVPVIVGGSTHEGEEAALLQVYKKLLSRFPGIRLVIAPRHLERFDGVAAKIKAEGFSILRRSGGADQTRTSGESVILLDTVGELANVYALASIAFVGGSLAKIGGHNIIEPASMGKPVLFGPHMHHFKAVKEAFLSEQAAVCVSGEEDLHNAITELLSDPARADVLGEAASRVVEANRGATDRYYQAIRKYF